MVFLHYSDINEFVPVEEGQYLLFMKSGTVWTGFWSNDTNVFMVDSTRGVYHDRNNIAFWAEIPSLMSLETNLYKEL